MPYLDHKERLHVEKYGATTIGQLTYLLFLDVRTWMVRQPVLKYQQHAELLGALEVIKLEAWDRFAGPYESSKRSLNGDVEAEKEASVQVSDSLPLEVGTGPGGGGVGETDLYSSWDLYSWKAEPSYEAPPCSEGWEEPRGYVDNTGPRVHPPDAARRRSHKKKRKTSKTPTGPRRGSPARPHRGVRKTRRSTKV